MPLFPDAALAAAPVIVALAVIGIIYGAVVAMMQSDIKKLVAYSSVSHLGFVMLGLFVFNTQGVQGAIYQMVSHGLSTGALFLLVGMIYDRRHTRISRANPAKLPDRSRSAPRYGVTDSHSSPPVPVRITCTPRRLPRCASPM